MADDFTVRFNNKALEERLSEIGRRIDDPSPAMLAIGESLTESTKLRFTSSTAPDGSKWKANAPATLEAVFNTIRKSSKRNGLKRAEAAKTNKKPLIASGLLQDTIRYQLTDDGKGVEIGTDRFAGEWDGGAAVHQFGSLDGDIPARPFLGISASDEVEVLQILNAFLLP